MLTGFVTTGVMLSLGAVLTVKSIEPSKMKLARPKAGAAVRNKVLRTIVRSSSGLKSTLKTNEWKSEVD